MDGRSVLSFGSWVSLGPVLIVLGAQGEVESVTSDPVQVASMLEVLQ